MQLPRCKSLDLELTRDWLTIWFNEPERRNPLTAERAGDLLRLCETLNDRRDIRGVTIRGKDGVFCAGGDLKSFQAAFAEPDARKRISALSKNGAALFDAVDQLPQFVVAVVEGPAMAGGFGLACCADCVVAPPSAHFSLSETRIGLVAAQIAPFVQRKVGLANARLMMLSANTLNSSDAQMAGLVDYLVQSDEDIDRVLDDIKSAIMKAAPQALATTKALLRDLPTLSRTDQIERAATDFADCLFSEEGREGITAFLAKRKPDWVPDGN